MPSAAANLLRNACELLTISVALILQDVGGKLLSNPLVHLLAVLSTNEKRATTLLRTRRRSLLLPCSRGRGFTAAGA